MRRYPSILLIVLGLVVPACGESEPVAETSGSDTTVTDTTAADTTLPGSDVDRQVRTFEVEGVEVVSITETVELPEHASRVEFASTVIDAGDGPVVCIGGVDDSLPPQCRGVVADGLDMTGWGQLDGGVWWGERNVTVTWPPVDGHVERLDDSEFQPPEFAMALTALPEECAGIERFVDYRAVNARAAEIGERSGGVYLTDDGTIVLQVTDDPEPHRQVLAAGGAEACVIQVDRSEAELVGLQSELTANHGGTLLVTGSSPGPRGRLDLTVPVADAATASTIATLVDEPDALRIIGEAVILRP